MRRIEQAPAAGASTLSTVIPAKARIEGHRSRGLPWISRFRANDDGKGSRLDSLEALSAGGKPAIAAALAALEREPEAPATSQPCSTPPMARRSPMSSA